MAGIHCHQKAHRKLGRVAQTLVACKPCGVPIHVCLRKVHTGVVFSADDKEVLRLNPDCGFVLHVLNQFKTRTFMEFNTTDTSWQWALQSAH